MYYGHLYYQKKRFENKPDIRDIRYDKLDRSAMMPTLWCLVFMMLFLVAGIASYHFTMVISPDKTHVHWKLFGKEMISEDGQIRSHHFIHPESCEICYRIYLEESKAE